MVQKSQPSNERKSPFALDSIDKALCTQTGQHSQGMPANGNLQ
jgi:hypothetical protein